MYCSSHKNNIVKSCLINLTKLIIKIANKLVIAKKVKKLLNILTNLNKLFDYFYVILCKFNVNNLL